MSPHTTTAGHLYDDPVPSASDHGSTDPDAAIGNPVGQPSARVGLGRVVLFTLGGLLLGLAAQTGLQHWRSTQAGPVAWQPPASALPAPAPAPAQAQAHATAPAPTAAPAPAPAPAPAARPVAVSPRPAAPRLQPAAVAQPAPRPAAAHAEAARPPRSTTGAVTNSPAGRLVPTPADDGHPAPAVLDASLIIAGEVHNADNGRLALPAGTRFQVSVWADQAGQLALYAVSPDGRASGQPLWRGPVQAGQAAQTAMLRLAGTRGLETLQIVLRGPTGDIRGHRQLQIWHL